MVKYKRFFLSFDCACLRGGLGGEGGIGSRLAGLLTTGGRGGSGALGGTGGGGAVSTPSVLALGSLRAKEHCVLQILSRRTASTPTWSHGHIDNPSLLFIKNHFSSAQTTH